MKFKIKFQGRKIGAIGKLSTFVQAVEAETESEAREKLHTEFEHIHFFSVQYSKLQERKLRQKREIEKHLTAIAWLLEQTGGSKLKVKTVSDRLRSIEYFAHRDAERYCNGEIEDINTDQYKRKVQALFNNNLKGLKINTDPRGYALKIDDAVMRAEYFNSGLQRDWGGYGLLAPEITGN